MKDKHNPAANPVWDEIGSSLKIMLRSANGEFGIMFMVKEDAVAAIVLGTGDTSDNRRLVAHLTLIRERLDEIIRHAEDDDFKFENGTKKFVRDEETGDYKPHYECLLCQDTGMMGVGKKCICQY